MLFYKLFCSENSAEKIGAASEHLHKSHLSDDAHNSVPTPRCYTTVHSVNHKFYYGAQGDNTYDNHG